MTSDPTGFSVNHLATTHEVDASGLKLAGRRVTGDLRVLMKADGWTLKADQPCLFAVDLTAGGNKLAGSFRGTYGLRKPRRGRLTGTYYSDD